MTDNIQELTESQRAQIAEMLETNSIGLLQISRTANKLFTAIPDLRETSLKYYFDRAIENMKKMEVRLESITSSQELEDFQSSSTLLDVVKAMDAYQERQAIAMAASNYRVAP